MKRHLTDRVGKPSAFYAGRVEARALKKCALLAWSLVAMWQGNLHCNKSPGKGIHYTNVSLCSRCSAKGQADRSKWCLLWQVNNYETLPMRFKATRNWRRYCGPTKRGIVPFMTCSSTAVFYFYFLGSRPVVERRLLIRRPQSCCFIKLLMASIFIFQSLWNANRICRNLSVFKVEWRIFVVFVAFNEYFLTIH